MNTQHTPGPWEVRGEFIGPRLASDSGIQIKVARVAGIKGNIGLVEDEEEALANAHLIAAAPELLAMVIRAEAMLPMIGDLAPVQRLLSDLRAAIAKARGGVA